MELESIESSSTDVDRYHFDTHAQLSIEATDLRTRLNQLN